MMSFMKLLLVCILTGQSFAAMEDSNKATKFAPAPAVEETTQRVRRVKEAKETKEAPSSEPTFSIQPSFVPSGSPTTSMVPSENPSATPTESTAPSAGPTESTSPSAGPTESNAPSSGPTDSMAPSSEPTDSMAPSSGPTDSMAPSSGPTESMAPSSEPTDSTAPSAWPTGSTAPSSRPTLSMIPSIIPTLSLLPSSRPTNSAKPSKVPTRPPTSDIDLFNNRNGVRVTSSTHQADGGVPFSTYGGSLTYCGTSITSLVRYYALVGKDMMVVTATIDQADFDVKLSVFKANFDTCVGGVDDANYLIKTNPTIAFETKTDVEYLVLVHGFMSQTGTFSLNFTHYMLPGTQDPAPANIMLAKAGSG